MKRTILVIGATGAQGGSVARHLLARGEFAVRALTRNLASEGAQELRALGAEVVEGSLDDRASLRAALKGVYGCFGVHLTGELAQGKNLINAVAGSTVEHFVFNSLRELEIYTKSMGIPSTFVQLGVAEDIGAPVAAIFADPAEYVGTTVSVGEQFLEISAASRRDAFNRLLA